jgi:hypothetical protein
VTAEVDEALSSRPSDLEDVEELALPTTGEDTIAAIVTGKVSFIVHPFSIRSR